jgi:hypothetical protein
MEYPYVLDSSFQPSDFMPVMPVMVTVTATHAEYHFSNGDWDLETISYMVDVSEEALEYVKNWLGKEDNNRLTVVFCKDGDYMHEFDEEMGDIFAQGSGGGWYLGNRVIFSFLNDITGLLDLNTHEAVHAYLDIFNITTDFLVFEYGGFYSNFFEEGLCTVIQFMFLAETTNERFIADLHQYLRQMGIRDRTNTTSILHGNARNLKSTFSADLLDYHKMWGFENRDMMPYPILQSYDTAASFIMFLLDHGTKEDFLQFYIDNDLFEKIYGYSVDEMIEQWLLIF